MFMYMYVRYTYVYLFSKKLHYYQSYFIKMLRHILSLFRN